MPYAITIFVSAFLLFQVQPIIAKYILPWYGGSPSVWTTCLLFFQIGLLLGYAYAHLIVSKLPVKKQVILHMALLLLACIMLPITPDDALKPSGTESPLLGILWLLTSTVGIPYMLISATGPLLQHWYQKKNQGKSPYRLYALSNIGSLLGLLTYPFLFEPNLNLDTQTIIWSIGFGVFVLACGWAGMVLYKVAEGIKEEVKTAVDKSEKLGWKKPIMWMGLSACGSLMLLATTNKITQDVAVIPFLWILPLSLYLISFIIAFDSPKWYNRYVWIPLFFISIALMTHILNQDKLFEAWDFEYQLVGFSFGLLCICMVCHGEMVRLKPPPQHLTAFYLMVSVGGAIGGLIVTLIAPNLFLGWWEFHIGLVVTSIFVAIAVVFSTELKWQATTKYAMFGAWMLFLAPVSYFLYQHVAGTMAYDHREEGDKVLIDVRRNFYGVIRIYEDDIGTNLHLIKMYHGKINHGYQLMDPKMKYKKTSYYSRQSGIGVAIRKHPKRLAYYENDDPNKKGKMRIGVIGLGSGTLAVYGYEGDYFRFYEINPEVLELTQKHFTYLGYENCTSDIILGDARIQMEREVENGNLQNFDILALDAFSGDAIPVHLLTREAFELYFKHIASDGILVVHVSNRHLNLKPVVRGISEVLDYDNYMISNSSDPDNGIKRSTWVIVTKNQEFLNNPEVTKYYSSWTKHVPEKVLWTDNFSNLFQVLKQ